ncbi:NAD(P)H-dependent oxidoreductase [Arthrobacter sp. ISL-69]|uniref:NAD(P)H-dependent oxidoreductase n=1 Tax=Arthrobacter sp. ISL-69 TaxID=2819113 RepID=UPI001BEB95EC|nr:NAD(P)H-dependent oxidoreductase [Arthrobacter sp. ISL-69]MBT2535486.1 NAD(P)H-dependent oxidoreductase [Arthrobacter sp. ISL-69]
MTTALIVGHPDLRGSRINAALVEEAASIENIDIRVLSDFYAETNIDIQAEQNALEKADHIVLQYPTFWYSTPAILKHWLDGVLARGWAYGTGTPGALAGKTLRIVTSTGGASDGYGPRGLHGWEYEAILVPLKATARRLGMRWLEPLVIHGVREVDEFGLLQLRRQFRDLITESLADPVPLENTDPVPPESPVRQESVLR